MIDKSLNYFVKIVECGSFYKASESLFISHAALIKQINNLEQRLKCTLLNRNSKGVTLTSSGEYFYKKAKILIRMSEKTKIHIKSLNEKQVKVIKVGSSITYPVKDFIKLWNEFYSYNNDFSLELVEIKDDSKRLSLVGIDYDILISPFDTTIDDNSCNFIMLGSYNFVLSMTKSNSKSKCSSLGFKDLKGETLCMMEKGISPVNDAIRELIILKYPFVKLKDIYPHYNTNTFNRIVLDDEILLSLECWNEVQPSLKSIPLNEDFKMPFGIVYSSKASEKVSMFISLIKEFLSKKIQHKLDFQTNTRKLFTAF